jgi:hypothetical protein
MQKENQEKIENKTLSQWVSVNNIQHTLKLVCFSLTGLCLLLSVLCFSLQDKTPTVVKEKAGELYYLAGRKKVTPINGGNISRLINKFIELRYDWDGKLDIDKISKDITPFVTKGFRKKTVIYLKNLQDKEFKGKRLDQGHTRPMTIVTKDSTTSSFDRVLRINNVPLPIPTQLSFNLVRGKVSYWNRLGLYINGVTIHEGP